MKILREQWKILPLWLWIYAFSFVVLLAFIYFRVMLLGTWRFMRDISYFRFLLLSFWKIHFCFLQCFCLHFPFSFLLKILLGLILKYQSFNISLIFSVFLMLPILEEFYDLVFLLTNLVFSDTHSAKAARLWKEFIFLMLYISSFFYLQCWFLFTLKMSHLFM